jgi:hypothetical protein
LFERGKKRKLSSSGAYFEGDRESEKSKGLTRQHLWSSENEWWPAAANEKMIAFY